MNRWTWDPAFWTKKKKRNKKRKPSLSLQASFSLPSLSLDWIKGSTGSEEEEEEETKCLTEGHKTRGHFQWSTTLRSILLGLLFRGLLPRFRNICLRIDVLAVTLLAEFLCLFLHEEHGASDPNKGGKFEKSGRIMFSMARKHINPEHIRRSSWWS